MVDSPSSLETGDRWAIVTSDDHSGILYIVAFLAFTYSTLTFIARFFIKWHILGLDDAAMSVAQVASIVQFSLLLVSLSAGLGKTFDLLSADNYARMAMFQYGSQIALYISLGFSKLATILITQRLFTSDMKKAWTICSVTTAGVAIWTVLAGFLVSVGCSSESMAPKIASDTCTHIIARYKFIVITDGITDIILVIVPVYLCWQLQMSILLKFQVLAVFAFRLPLVVLAGLFLKAWIRSLSASNPGVDRSSAIMFHQCELCVSLITGTIPCLKSFIQSFDTGSGVKAGFGSFNGYGSSGRTGSDAPNNESYQLESLDRSKNSTIHTRSRTVGDGEIRVSIRPFTSARSNPPPPKARETSASNGYKRAQQELDRESQGSREDLLIQRGLAGPR